MCHKCPLCVFQAPTIQLVLQHMRSVHSSDPNFLVTCGLNGCPRTFRNFSSFYQHIYRNHKDTGIIQSRGYNEVAISLQTEDCQQNVLAVDLPNAAGSSLRFNTEVDFGKYVISTSICFCNKCTICNLLSIKLYFV